MSKANFKDPAAPGVRLQMDDIILTVAATISALLLLVHVADDIVRGFEEGGLWNLMTIPLAVVWLWGGLVLSGRRSGYVTVLLFPVLGSGIPVLHFMGKGVGVGSRIAGSSGAFFFILTLFVMGTTALLSVMLAARGLWRSRHGRTSGRLSNEQ